MHQNTNIHYSHIIHECMNTQKGIGKLKTIRILLDSGCGSKNLTRSLIANLNPKKYTVVQWYTQASNNTTNLKVEIDFTLPELSATIIVT